MNVTDLSGLLVLAVPVLSLTGIALSATARERSVRWVAGVLGWVGWLLSVALAAFIGLVLVAFSCWGNSAEGSCGESGVALVAVGALVLAALPGVLAYGLTARLRAERRVSAGPAPPLHPPGAESTQRSRPLWRLR